MLSKSPPGLPQLKAASLWYSSVNRMFSSSTEDILLRKDCVSYCSSAMFGMWGYLN